MVVDGRDPMLVRGLGTSGAGSISSFLGSAMPAPNQLLRSGSGEARKSNPSLVPVRCHSLSLE